MADDVSAPTLDLYEADFYAWTQAQAALLRQRAGSDPGIDWERLAEEVGDMGKRDLNAVRSHVRHIIEHLFKLAASGREEPKNHWRREVKTFRAEAKDFLTPSIRAKVATDLEVLHAQAFDIARTGFETHEPGVTLNSEQRWTLPQILGEQDDPLDGSA